MIQLPLRLPDPQKPYFGTHFGRQLDAGGGVNPFRGTNFVPLG